MLEVRRRLVLVSALAAAGAAGGAGLTWRGGLDGAQGPADVTRAPIPATGSIERGDLRSMSIADGTVRFSSERELTSDRPGIVTWLARSASTITRDESLYAVNGLKTRLMYGTMPMYRQLSSGDTGPDVRQLKSNLRLLGFGPELAHDDVFSSGTKDAVKGWQEAHGLDESGVVEPGDIAFVAGPVRIQDRQAHIGTRVGIGQVILTVTSRQRLIDLDVKVTDAVFLSKGKSVKIVLPGNTTTTGRVQSVGSTAHVGDDPDDQEPRIGVRVVFDHPGAVKGIDKSPATVSFSGKVRKNVLSVPVGALLARPGGGFAIQVVDGTATRDVAVELGMFAEARVEISGTGLRDGLRVGVATT